MNTATLIGYFGDDTNWLIMPFISGMQDCVLHGWKIYSNSQHEEKYVSFSKKLLLEY